MWYLLKSIASSRIITILRLPVAIVIGTIGFCFEGLISDKYTPPIPSVQDERQNRLLDEPKGPESLKDKTFVPKTVFEKNLSPSLQKHDDRGSKHQNKD